MEYILEAKNITKRFGGVLALDDVNFELEKNEIMALVGDNGAGKSTLIKILSGVMLLDQGEIYIENRKVNIDNPIKAKELGIETVYQDLALVDTLNVYNNLFLGREELRNLGFIRVLDKKKMGSEAKQILKKLGIEVENVEIKVSKLSGGQRQAIAVAKAASWGKKIVIMDEPTAALGVKESAKILEIIKSLKEMGTSIIVITHNMQHAFLIADRIFVLRLGKRVCVKRKDETSIDDIVKNITSGSYLEQNGCPKSQISCKN